MHSLYETSYGRHNSRLLQVQGEAWQCTSALALIDITHTHTQTYALTNTHAHAQNVRRWRIGCNLWVLNSPATAGRSCASFARYVCARVQVCVYVFAGVRMHVGLCVIWCVCVCVHIRCEHLIQ